MLLLTIALAALLAAAATWAAIPWLAQSGALAHENERTMHSGSVPKGGGLPLLAAAFIALAATAPIASLPATIIGGTLLLVALSWLDDLKGLPAVVRLPVHLSVATWAVWSLPEDARVFQGWLPYMADRATAAIALAWMMNLFNFMDGINAIAGVETIAIATGYLAVACTASQSLQFTALAATLIGACAGFLVWNAREKPFVFLGDVGSVPLGFLAGVLMLDLAVKGFWAAALILPGYFLLDATLTLLKRALRGERIWEPHRTHTYQRAATAIGAHLPIVARIAGANLMLIGLAVLSTTSSLAAIAAAVIVLAALMLNLEQAARSRSSDSDPSRP